MGSANFGETTGMPSYQGRIAFGTDDNYQWSTGGFGNIREMQLLLESGIHPLEVLQAATYNSAETILEPRLGLVQTGYVADLLVVDGSPAENFRYLYPLYPRDKRFCETYCI